MVYQGVGAILNHLAPLKLSLNADTASSSNFLKKVFYYIWSRKVKHAGDCK